MSEKSWAEKMKLATCKCGHTNTVHAGGIYDCGFVHCTCQQFEEQVVSEPRSAFQEVKKIMQGE